MEEQHAGMRPGSRRFVGGASWSGRGRVLVWDPAEPGTGPAELGRHYTGVAAGAVLPDGRVVTGGGVRSFAGGGRVLVWDPAEPGTGPVDLGRDDGEVETAAVLPDGRVVTGGGGLDGGILVWDPAEPGTLPAELALHGLAVKAVAVLPDGQVIIGGRRQVRLRKVESTSPDILLVCSAYAFATSLSPSGARLFISHAVDGISCWEIRPSTQNTPGAGPRAGSAIHQQR
jgi:hypothetical protein